MMLTNATALATPKQLSAMADLSKYLLDAPSIEYWPFDDPLYVKSVLVLINECNSTAPYRVYCDKSLLRQAVRNIATVSGIYPDYKICRDVSFIRKFKFITMTPSRMVHLINKHSTTVNGSA